MISSIPNKRPNCDEILFNEQWSINMSDISNLGLDDSEMMVNQPANFVCKYFHEKILSFNRFDKRFKVLQNLSEGDFGSVYKVENKSDRKVFTIKKIPNGMRI